MGDFAQVLDTIVLLVPIDVVQLCSPVALQEEPDNSMMQGVVCLPSEPIARPPIAASMKNLTLSPFSMTEET